MVQFKEQEVWRRLVAQCLFVAVQALDLIETSGTVLHAPEEVVASHSTSKIHLAGGY